LKVTKRDALYEKKAGQHADFRALSADR